MKKRIAAMVLTCALVATVFIPQAVMAEENDLAGTKITFLNTKTEILKSSSIQILMKIILQKSLRQVSRTISR